MGVSMSKETGREAESYVAGGGQSGGCEAEHHHELGEMHVVW